MKWIIVLGSICLFSGCSDGEKIDVKKYIASQEMISKVQNYSYNKVTVTDTNEHCTKSTIFFPPTVYEGKTIHPKQKSTICIQGNTLVNQNGDIILDASGVWTVPVILLDENFFKKEVKSTCRVVKKYAKVIFNKKRDMLEIKCGLEKIKSTYYMVEGVGSMQSLPIE